ncbi:xanthine dehydrogenase family protein molybdopterin-binding subunit [Frigidibacter sp. MR17.14]|uniref:xanthine dehydrogenase family protein molybdopterin-binding subunit n=1 Tax=Frigidibacter sp. MR17.14 TaxID=3126509 RepID=UPI003012E767
MQHKFGKSQSLKRLEDVRFLTGAGRYLDDIAPATALHAAFLRAPAAHAEIRSLHLDDARAMPGVVLVLGAADLAANGVATDQPYDTFEGAPQPPRPLLARDRVRFVGEAMALVVAETAAAARDAVEAIGFDLAELPVHIQLAPGGAPIHPEAPDNLAFTWDTGDAVATEAAFARAAHVVRQRVVHNRVIVNSVEPRAATAEWIDGRLHFHVNGQGVWDQKAEFAAAFGIDPAQVRVTTPDVGGGFGMKSTGYPEFTPLALAAKLTGRPVRWISERTEAMLTDNGGRDLVTEAALAFDADLKIIGYRVDLDCAMGAYNAPFGAYIQSELFAKVLTGAYDIPAAHLRVRGIYTNTTQTDAYRGAGRPEAITTLERVVDRAARVLGIDPWELRAKSYVTSFPYRTATGELYDVGDFPRVAARARAEADEAGFEARRAASEAEGLLRGLGTCFYIESILGSPTEAAEVEFRDDGTVNLYVGTQSNGQGHETVYAAFLSERTGIPVEAIRVVQGDSDRIASGGGTGGSRSVTTQTNATLATVDTMVAAFRPFVAAELGVETVDWADLGFRAPGSNLVLTLAEAADRARRAGREDLLKHRAEATLPGRSYPNGAHLCEVEIDPETGLIRLDRYSVTDDFGNLIHPMLVEGQVHGGIAQGMGQAMMEGAVWDETGQLLSATFMDYAMPRAADMPFVKFTTEPVPSTANLLGMKGCGEAGTVASIAAVSNAVLDALAPLGIEEVEMPFRPAKIWTQIEAARLS